MHTSPAINTDMSLTGNGYGVKYDPTLAKQYLRLTLQIDDNHVHASGQGSYNANQGVEVHLNSKIFGIKFDTSIADYFRIEDCAYGTTACVRNNVPLTTWKTNAATTCTTCNMTELTQTNTLRGRFWLKAATAQSYFNNNAGGAVKEFSFNNVYVKRQANLRSDQYISDAFVGFINGSAAFTHTVSLATTDYRTRIMFSSYTVSLVSTWSNLKVSYSMFWTGSAGQGALDGSKFPAVIRIKGYMSYAEKVNVKRFEVFFKDIVPFLKDTSATLGVSNEIYCAGTLAVKCYSVGGTTHATLDDDVYNEKMISIDVVDSI